MKKTLVGMLTLTSLVRALPEGGQVVQGQVQILQPGTNVLQVLQSSPSGIINWGSFSIDANQLVQFLQPDSSAALLNRVVGQDPSQILGQLQANGRIFLLNPNGMLFGPGSSINAGSFVASTLSLSDQDFLAGRYNLRWDGQSPLRAIVNQGEIRVADGGFLALISPLLDNQGLLLAERGQVVLGATRQATLTVDANGLLQVAIPDGFQAHSAPNPNPGTLLLTQAQMSDTLASLIRPAGNESAAIVETPLGIQLVGAEGLLLNSGTVQAHDILLDSSQATVLTETGQLTGTGDNARILALSAGSAVQMGRLAAPGLDAFVEVSGRSVHMTRGAELGPGGQMLIDPGNVTVTGGAGTRTPPILFGDDPGTNQTVEASALNVTGTVRVQATNNVSVDPGVQINIDNNTQLVLEAGNDFTMNAGSAINASNPASTVTINATNDAQLTDLRVPTGHVTAGNRVTFTGGTVGVPTSDTVLNVSAGNVSLAGQNDIVAQNHARVAFNATSDVVLNADARVNLQANLANITMQGDALGVTFLDRSSLNSSGAANVTLSSPTGGIFFQADSALNLAGPANVTVNSPDQVFIGGTINANNAASSVNISAGGQLTLGNLLVPTNNLHSDTFVQLNNTTVGVDGSPTVLNVTANRGIVPAFAGSTVNIRGSQATVNLTAAEDVFFGQDSTFNLLPGQANLTATANNPVGTTAVFVGVNTTLNLPGTGNVTFNTVGNQLMREGSRIDVGTGNVILTSNGGGRITMFDGSTISADAANVTAAGGISVGNLLVSTSNLNSLSGGVDFQNSTVGVAGSPTVLNVSGVDVRLSTSSQSRILGSTANVTLAGTQFTAFEGSGLDLAAGATNLNVTTDVVQLRDNSVIQSATPGNVSFNPLVGFAMSPNATIDLSHPNSRVDVRAGTTVSTANLRVPTINLQAGEDVAFFSGTLGRPGTATSIAASSLRDTFIIAGNNVTVDGTQVQFNINSNRDILVASESSLQLNGTSNDLEWNAANVNLLRQNTTLSGSGPTRLHLAAGFQASQLANSTIDLPNSGSNVSIDSQQTIFMNRVVSGGKLAAIVTVGNVRVTDQVRANEIHISTPQQLISAQNSTQAALVANSTLNVTAAQISGPMDDPANDLTKAFPFATGGNAVVRFNVTGTNNTNFGNRAANLFYYFPQSGDVQILHPNGDVKIFNEPAPTPPPQPPAQTQPGVIDSRDDLTSEQFVELTAVTAQNQIQLSNLYSAENLPVTSEVVMLDYDNAGLTGSSYFSLPSAVVEVVVLSPENSARNVERIESESARGSSLVVAGNDEDAELRYWRKLIEGFIIWEDS